MGGGELSEACRVDGNFHLDALIAIKTLVTRLSFTTKSQIIQFGKPRDWELQKSGKVLVHGILCFVFDWSFFVWDRCSKEENNFEKWICK